MHELHTKLSRHMEKPDLLMNVSRIYQPIYCRRAEEKFFHKSVNFKCFFLSFKFFFACYTIFAFKNNPNLAHTSQI